jgi:hypothetical protein
MITDSHLTNIVDPDTFSNPNVISNLQAPWIFDADSWFDYDSRPDAGTK